MGVSSYLCIFIMIFGCWNIRGLNDPLKQREVRNLIKDEKLSLCGLVETKVLEKNKDVILKTIDRSWKVECNYNFSSLGRIWVCWNPFDVTVLVVGSSEQVIHCRVSSVDSTWECMISIVYGDNCNVRREALWADLVARGVEWENSAWIVMGDFNAIKSSVESVGGSNSWPHWKDDFSNCLAESGLDDLRFNGCFYTWSNHRTVDPILRKLDRALVNLKWDISFRGSEAHFLPSSVSDHSPMIVKIVDLPRRRVPFKFFDFWADHPEFLSLVDRVWADRVDGSPMFQLCKKLKRLKVELKKLNRECYSDLSSRVQQAKHDLESVQWDIQRQPTNISLHGEESRLVKLYGDLSRDEESFLRQKSRVQWINLGDRNSKFFFRSMRQRCSRSKVLSLTDEHGNRVEEPSEVKSMVVNFFETLLRQPAGCPRIDLDLVRRALPKRISGDQCATLGREVSDVEIKAVLFSLKDNKAPGPDGYNATFFKKAWSVVGDDFLRAIRSFFSSGRLLKQVNATVVALIPKVPNPSTVGDFRPISCCNTIYKCIAKIIANRVQMVLPDVVSPFQSAFVAGRRISDNILLSQELLRNYHRDGGHPRCALKVDLMKAYDSVRWDFLVAILQILGFPEQMIAWISECISTPRFSISINGELNGFFASGRGLRQGDPMSPYLFVLAMEVFSGLMRIMEQESQFAYHWRCGKIGISHLCFADDLMVFCRAERESVAAVNVVLGQFQALSGLIPNPSKSNLFVAGVSSETKQELLGILGFQEGVLPVRYLGVPLISTKLTAVDCRVLVDRIVARVKSWTSRVLSFAGRLQLIQSVLFSIQVYWSSIFILPKSVVIKVETTLRSFLWKGSDLGKGGAKVAWSSVCLPKEEGGLGIKSVECWNKAAISKHLWAVCSNLRSSVWVSWVRSTLLKGKNVWEVRCPGDCSWSWRKILGLRCLVRRLMQFRVGNGEDISLWFDYWHPLGPLVEVFGRRIIYDSGFGLHARVADVVQGRDWAWPRSLTGNWMDIISGIPASFRPNNSQADTLCWVEDSRGAFSIRNAWEALRSRQPAVDWFRSVWHSKSIPRHAFIFWLAIRGALSTQDKLLVYGLIPAIRCVFCGGSCEDVPHLFFDCSYSCEVWFALLRKCRLPLRARSWEDTILWSCHFRGRQLRGWVVRIMLAAAVYAIWRERNARMHGELPKPVTMVVRSIVRDVCMRLNSLSGVMPSPTNRWLHQSWGLSDSIFL